jgi:hypothetical protein
VEERLPLVGGEVAERFVVVEQCRTGEGAPHPAADAEGGEADGAVVERPVAVDELFQVD